MDIVIISGYFDPVHVGHLELLKEAKRYGEELWVVVNNDYQAELKKGNSFMDAKERAKIMSEFKYVNRVLIAIDKDRSVNETLKMIRHLCPEDNLVFANGGDVNKKNCREHKTCKELGILTIYGLGDKIQSSSWLTGIRVK
jgi:cytidyltransferase-like protein